MTDEISSTVGARVVAGVDGSESSKAALRWALRQAALTGASVDAVMTWDRPPAWYGFDAAMIDPAELHQATARELDQVVEEVAGPNPEVEVRALVLEGHPASALIDVSRDADLLVLGTRGHGGFTGALLGSVTQYCVQQAACPVVVVREPRA